MSMSSYFRRKKRRAAVGVAGYAALLVLGGPVAMVMMKGLPFIMFLWAGLLAYIAVGLMLVKVYQYIDAVHESEIYYYLHIDFHEHRSDAGWLQKEWQRLSLLTSTGRPADAVMYGRMLTAVHTRLEVLGITGLPVHLRPLKVLRCAAVWLGVGLAGQAVFGGWVTVTSWNHDLFGSLSILPAFVTGCTLVAAVKAADIVRCLHAEIKDRRHENARLGKNNGFTA